MVNNYVPPADQEIAIARKAAKRIVRLRVKR